MTTGSIIWLLILLGLSGAYYRFISRGRTYGYQALASRTNQLLEQGVNQVWLLYGDKGVGFNINLSHTSVWTLLNTGFLAYISDGKFVIEYPWWNKMKPMFDNGNAQLNPRSAIVLYNRKAYPAVKIGHQSYVVTAMNLQNVSDIKQRLNFKGHADAETLLRDFMNSLTTSQISISSVAYEQPRESQPIINSRLSLLKIIRGTFLYILLPCLILTAATVLWAILTKQPAFR
ncbi:MAG: hypothetical protein JWS12_100 [Candidatus Saccharibacteria bacterium]|nr:hypothetical protein [Candidatus Saccharibacteria bacterium]